MFDKYDEETSLYHVELSADDINDFLDMIEDYSAESGITEAELYALSRYLCREIEENLGITPESLVTTDYDHGGYLN